MNLKNLNTSAKLIIGFGLIIFFTISISFIGASGIFKVFDQTTTLRVLGNARSEYNLARLYIRSYVHTRDIYFSSKIEPTLNGVLDSLGKIKLTITDKSEIEIVNSLSQYISKYLENSIGAANNVYKLNEIISIENEKGEEIIAKIIDNELNYKERIITMFCFARINTIKYMSDFKLDKLQNALKLITEIENNLTPKEKVIVSSSLNQYKLILSGLEKLGND